jgi:hypothetical protein
MNSFLHTPSICVVVGIFGRQHACPEQVRTCCAIHRALDCLQAVDLTFSLTIALAPDRNRGKPQQRRGLAARSSGPGGQYLAAGDLVTW